MSGQPRTLIAAQLGSDEQPLTFYKLQAGGNDFIVFIDALPDVDTRAALARTLCQRYFSVGADGVIFADKVEPRGSIQLEGFNPDGSSFALCTNGFRCAAWLCAQLGLAQRNCLLSTVGGPLQFRMWGNWVRIGLPRPTFVKSLSSSGAVLSTGDVHVVANHRQIGMFSSEAASVREQLKIDGLDANVHFISGHRNGRWLIRSYERGVNQETLSCGSGCLAAAEFLSRSGNGSEFTFQTRGGTLIRVSLHDSAASITAAVAFVFEGRVSVPFLATSVGRSN